MLTALVLTAGLGTRLDPITRLVAKPAVAMAGRTLIEHVLAWLQRESVRDVVLNLHFKPETITRVVGDGAHLGLRVRYSWEQPILGSAGGPRHALGLLDSDPMLIVNGDTLCDVSLGPMIEAHRASGADVLMAVVPNPAPDHYNGIRADADGVVTGFVKKGPDAAGSWHYVGIQIARKSIFAPLPDEVPTETVHGVYRELVARGSRGLRIWPVTDRFLDVGTPNDYLAAVRLLSPTAVNSVIWPDAHIGRSVTFDSCIVAGPVHVPDGFHASRKIVLPSSVSRPGDRSSLVGDCAVFDLSA